MKYGGKGGELFNKKYRDEHYVTADPSNSPLLFQFRIIDKTIPNIHKVKKNK